MAFIKKGGILVLALMILWTCTVFADDDLPVLVPKFPKGTGSIRNKINFKQLHNITGPDLVERGLVIDLEDPTLQGRVYTGPYPFEDEESDYDYARYRVSGKIENGSGLLPIANFFRDTYNANDWPTDNMAIAYRLDLWRTSDDGMPQHLGFHDSVINFIRKDNGDFQKNLTLVEGPFVGNVSSDNPSSVIIAWETDEASVGSVLIAEAGAKKKELSFVEAASSRVPHTRHEIEVPGLKPDKEYKYRISYSKSGGSRMYSSVYSLKTAPLPGRGEVTFAFVSDSREGVGGGELNYMGSNFYILNRLAIDAYRRGAAFYLFGGDLVNGYTSEPEDFRLQLKGWKQAMAGYWRERPVYPAMGNHETLLNVFDNGSKYGLSMDKWPYESDSAEAVFAQEFFNPLNGPEASDPRRPTYAENVFSFQHGPVLCIAYNNNYWWSSNYEVKNYGGSPEGYIMLDQLEWIEKKLSDAESNKTVKYIVLYAQEPVFPCGGHVGDSMWWNGNNNFRAYSRPEGFENVVPERAGMIEVRNRFWKAIANSSKVAAVMAGDEHEYYRLLVDSETPVGLYPQDDMTGDGILNQYSPNPEFKYPVWHITAGTAGAPYYARQNTPWEPLVLSSQHGYCLFKAGRDGISMTYYSITGQAVDYVDNLMAAKRKKSARGKTDERPNEDKFW